MVASFLCFAVRLLQFTPQLSAASAATSVVGACHISGVMFSDFPPPGIVLAALLARLPVVVVINVVTVAATKRTRLRQASALVRWWCLHGVASLERSVQVPS